MVSSCVMNNILRYEGRAFFAMIGLTSGGFLNIFLDAYFIRVLHMGIEGAGLATAISQYLSFGILLSMFLRKKTQTTFEIRYISFTVKTLGEIVTTGLPSPGASGTCQHFHDGAESYGGCLRGCRDCSHEYC